MSTQRNFYLFVLILLACASSSFAQGAGSWANGIINDAFVYMLALPACVAVLLMMALGSIGRGSTALTICSTIFGFTALVMLITGWVGVLVGIVVVPWILVVSLAGALIFGKKKSLEPVEKKSPSDTPPIL